MMKTVYLLLCLLQLSAAAGKTSSRGHRGYYKQGCGELNEECCEHKRCTAGAVCNFENKCKTCGEKNNLCCADDVCEAGLACAFDQKCVDCGGDDEIPCPPCADGNCPTCKPGFVLSAGRCTPCGEGELKCCDNNVCGNGLICEANGFCGDCGTNGASCCEDNACGHGLVCGIDGTCGLCGGSTQTCCAGRLCGQSLICSEDNECVACGDSGSRCCCEDGANCGPKCEEGLVCGIGDECTLCGSSGQPCCEGEGVTACDSQHVCRSGQCEACGAVGDACCDNEGENSCAPEATCRGGMCVQCGKEVGDPCCYPSNNLDSGCSINNLPSICAGGVCQGPILCNTAGDGSNRNYGFCVPQCSFCYTGIFSPFECEASVPPSAVCTSGFCCAIEIF